MLRKIITGVALLCAASFAFAHGYQVGDLNIHHPWARATVAGAHNGGVFMTITSAKDDQLLKAETELADKVEFHEMKMVDGMMKMRPIASLPLAAESEVKLAPGGYHIMLFGLKRQLIEGEKFPMKLTFARGCVVNVEVKVENLTHGAASAPEHAAH
ncbi:copper chaperone PCu(A)C [Chitinibacter bivalviorum]|uniref:Copper chaperone PCu(A)C n=1 Tax=Chitinibacter bivalviorum TaxID=2739434 RepID=A0A7H9BM37_9NEIS|nr:copper chaperone PCu(A)C [Chitinibacter bivalviorum]QLG89683.1 copper chaperone PCu(A)C [Chitinibacter bivalviorum]